jgi:hypothetical protein
MFKQSLIKVRITESTPLIMATPTNNLVRINQPAAELLGVNFSKVNKPEGQYIAGGVVSLDGEERLVFACVPKDAGEEVAKLASPTGKDYGSLQFASGGIHYKLNGDNDHNVVWRFTDKVDCDEEGNATILEDNEVAKGAVGYLVEFLETRDAMKGKQVTTSATSVAKTGKGTAKKVAVPQIEADDDFLG